MYKNYSFKKIHNRFTSFKTLEILIIFSMILSLALFLAIIESIDIYATCPLNENQEEVCWEEEIEIEKGYWTDYCNALPENCG